MDEGRRTQIANALQQYRETVTRYSFVLVRTMVEAMEAQPLPPGCSARVAQILHMQELRRFFQGAIPESVQAPRDLLSEEVRDEFIRLAGLDGVAHYLAINPQLRERYFAAIRTRIAEKNVKVAEFPPADLEYLCTLVSGISGLPYYREQQQFDFISAVEEHYLQEMVENVTVPIQDGEGAEYNELSDIWEDWEIAIAFKIGTGPRSWGGSYALYCRNEDKEQWKWRYGVHDEEWCSDVYDSVEEFLGFYTHFEEQTEERVRRDIRDLKGLLGR
ncbi:hypothetical protein B7463_g5901, partial [Scytalidium lignicola]